MNINKAMIYGNLTRDPEVRQLPSGAAVSNFGVATNRHYTNQQTNEKVEETEFHNVVLFGRLAELAQEYLKKGSGVYIEGRLRTSSWEADGVKKYRTEIIGEQMQFGPRRSNDGASSSRSGSYAASGTATAGAASGGGQPAPTINPDDIPF